MNSSPNSPPARCSRCGNLYNWHRRLVSVRSGLTVWICSNCGRSAT